MPELRTVSVPVTQPFVVREALLQEHVYLTKPDEIVAHANQEKRALDAYRGRQILELLQNADDAGEGYTGNVQLYFELDADALVAANSGVPFTEDGVRSLITSDLSPKQYSRARLIGNKGLGFRSVLSWSETPLVCSSEHMVAFSPAHAMARLEQLAAGAPEVLEWLQRYETRGLTIRPATLRFPLFQMLRTRSGTGPRLSLRTAMIQS